ncbi:uncharacterized protein UTRI_04994_B [Ustilago trichophora]|uniref:Mig1 protein n=1 Tax=Ustilago trichophora TaxID=86804 RepID=A0A5C3EH67_9BASI|nr:uncharacterized protein UTRI_04994_B [Ustilago trichophora]
MKVAFLLLFSLISCLSVAADNLLPYQNYCGPSNDAQARACFHLSTDGDSLKGTSAIYSIVHDTVDGNNYAVLPQSAFQTTGWQGTVTHFKSDVNCVNVHLETQFGVKPKVSQDYVTCKDDNQLIPIW